tara:strand:- start:26698 stop:27753 length:1056 start_codon:yes stop_codon:yes gene_type:complete
MIKLLQAKEDIYWEDSFPDQKPFCKKGGWYEVISSSKADLQFKNEEGMAHIWSLSDLDEDFWTVDFDKGFEFKTSLYEDYSFKNNFLVGTDTYYNDYRIGIAIGVIKQNGWEITRFSNQPEQPSVEDRPFENWKKDIGKGKFQRCIENPCVVFCVIGDINGYLDMKNDTFYYHKYHQGKHTYISCSVAQSVHDGWYFVRENKDSSLVKAYSPEAKGMVVKEDILASFSVPVDNKDIEQQESSKGEVEVSSADASVCIDKEGITSDGGKSEYYKIVLPQWLLDRQQEEGYIMLEDLAEVMYGNDFNYTNVFKAQKRMYEMQRGMGKKGNTLEYDATKVKYYVDKQLEVFNRD